MAKNYEKLFSEIDIAGLTLKNRVALAPMTRISATDNGVVTERMEKYYTKFAKGGFSLIITEGIYPDEKYSQGYFNQPGIANDIQAASWKNVIESVHEQDSKIIAQLMHAGALSQGNIYQDSTIGPSAVKPKGKQLAFYKGEGEFALPKEMTLEDIQDVKNSFVNAAKNAKEVGFDGVEIHGANGYILDQFLTDYTNQRTDEYGGSTEKRVKLLVEVTQEIRKAVGEDFTVGIRISQAKVNDPHHKWAGKEKDAEIIFSSLANAGVDFIHITEPKANEAAFEGSSVTLVDLAKQYGQVPVIANGSLENPDKAEQMLATGHADLITLGKGALANQDWPNKVKHGEPLEEFNAQNHLLPIADVKEREM
ncbi:NADH:flavin oxidoreductase [Halalkalibacter nanhaiisediminis]|uniref:2,4-dienoyl-CoA reductase-like NADH-dependent reductase (Old Yellow Enzyme family) n=1 Tax=Halalkalibacter nanhaiisediminis TaxID=688079 RepID=A0A562QMT9_9BACI|nr:NADH:flavin oxidoreductase [Halalkalibacter nanhaiisediminis]TWI58059.1 2,4-dienoyl-CoA reductase-like NADH-dependent reductase (Old Yellow Enzyme family) [Halalkalibacter nanhaiisediminis]